MASFVLRFEDRRELEREYAQNFAHGRAFVAGTLDVALYTPCALVLEHPESKATLHIEAEVIMVLDQGATRGVALQFRDRSDAELARIAAFATARAADNENADASSLDELDDADEASEFEDATGLHARSSSAPRANLVQERQLRLRNLSIHEQLKVARSSNMSDRVLLERIYGAAVWEALLKNSKITVPEVARIAKKGTIPRPLVDLIVENEGWIHQSIVRRALLSNPRLSSENALKILRILPHRELKLVPHQNAYPATVRALAMRLLKSG